MSAGANMCIKLRKFLHDRKKITPYILDENHYIIIEPKWSNIRTLYTVSRYYIDTVWGEPEGGIVLLKTKKQLKKYIKEHNLRKPSEEELKHLMSIKDFRVRMYIDFAELEETTLSEEEYLNKVKLLM